MSNSKLTLGTALVLAIAPQVASAEGPAEGEAGGSASVSLGGGGGGVSADGEASAASGMSAQEAADRDLQKRKDQPWLTRWKPEKGVGEIGLYGGVFFSSPNHELFKPDLDLQFQGWKKLRLANLDVGMRAGYYPLTFLGIEMEGGIMPLSTDDGNAMGYHVRGHVLGQLPFWSITPFVVLGAGAMGVSSGRAVLGNDIDPALHYGLGAKAYINRYTMVRLDFRNIVSYGVDVDAVFNDPGAMELLLGVSVALGRKKREAEPVEEPPPPPPPPAPEDRDGDGFTDDLDACPEDPGVEPDGCPISDTDGDGILDPDDKCPEEAGVEEYEGCPVPDKDGDGIMDEVDKCVDEPETKNDYQDDDGCPDEVPEAVKKFSGIIEGIYFDTGKASIKPQSEKILRRALKVLKDYPEVKLEVYGHTDSRGDHDKNMDLSKRRAESVREWLVNKGIDGGRITTEGFGSDQPVDSNETKAGRAKNRRIEFKLR